MRSAPAQMCQVGLPARSTRRLFASTCWRLQAAREWLVQRDELCGMQGSLLSWLSGCLASTACPRETQRGIHQPAAQTLWPGCTGPVQELCSSCCSGPLFRSCIQAGPHHVRPARLHENCVHELLLAKLQRISVQEVPSARLYQNTSSGTRFTQAAQESCSNSVHPCCTGTVRSQAPQDLCSARVHRNCRARR